MAAPSGTVWGSVVTGSKSTRKGKIGLYISTSSTATTTTVTVQVWFWSMYSVDDDANTFYYDADATSASTSRGSVDINHTVSSGDGWSTSNQTRLGTYTHSYTRGTSSQTKYFAAKLADIDVIGTMTVYSSATIPALSSYTVSYNANGGSGAPSSQTKWYGKTLTLSSTKPTRTGYSFQGWGTSASDTSVDYAAGASYTANSGITLYAIWKANTYAVKYNANGGSGAPSQQTKTYGKTLTLSSTKPTRTNYNFKGWGTSASATTVSYAAGASYTANAAITLYAVWELAYWNPKITSFTVSRCTSDGTSDSVGTYALVKFKWECCQLLGENNVSAITVVCNGVTTTVSASGTSGTASQIVGDGALDIEESYSVKVTVADSQSGSSSSSKTLATASFPIDVLAGGTGIAFGKVAETAKMIETPWRNQSTYTDVGFAHKHPTSGVRIGYGVGSGGTNRGIYDYAYNKWIFCHDGEKLYLNSAGGTIETNSVIGVHTMMAYASPEITLSTAFQKISFTDVLQSDYGGFLTLTDGAIECEREGRVLASAMAYVRSGVSANDLIHMGIYRDESNMCSHVFRAPSTYSSFAVPPRIIYVTAGQIISLRIRNETAARGVTSAGTSQTLLTVMYIQ